MIRFHIPLLLVGGAMAGAAMEQQKPSDNADIAFGPDGAVSSLTLEAGGANLIDQANPGRGFSLEVFASSGPRQYRLERVERQGSTLLVSRAGEPSPRFTFDISSGPRYLALKLKRVERSPTNLAALHLEMRCRAQVVMQGLDYMFSTSVRGQEIRADWKYLWHRHATDPLGGVAFYLGGQPEKEDEALLDVWVKEDLCRPAVKEAWTRDRALQWLKDFEKRYGDQTMMILAAASPEELYALTEKAQRIGVKQIYLHTDTWRGEYWPVKYSHIHVNPTVFPRGIADLKKYADYLRERGMFLALHYTSGGIGPHDPERIAGKVHKDLAAWGAGKLEESLTPDAKVLRFRPDPGTEFPIIADGAAERPQHTYTGIFNPMSVRVDNEIIGVGSFEDKDKPVWTLTGCSRGRGATKAASHEKGAAVAGLLSAYGQNFVPGPDSALLEEMAREYASFANTIGLGRLEYDALEINAVVPWGDEKFTELVARNIDHPVITGCSGGYPVWGNTEVKFNRYRHLSAPGNAPASFNLETGNRRATAEFEFEIGLSWAAAHGATKLLLQKSEAMFGLSREMLAAHGLSGQFLNIFQRWRAVIGSLTPEQRGAMRKVMAAPPAPKRTRVQQWGGGGHASFRILETANAYELVPVTVLSRPVDAPWMSGTESSAVAPRQFILPGQTLEMNNPYAAQPLSWTIRVLPEVVRPSTSASIVGSSDKKDILDSYRTGVASAREGMAAAHPLVGAKWVWYGNEDPAIDAGDKTVYLHKKIVIPAGKVLRGAYLFFTADNSVDCYVNGRRVGGNRTWELVRTASLMADLKPGENLIGLAAKNSGGPGGCIACLQLQFDKEALLTLPTDGSWKATDRHADGWMNPDFNDAPWKNASAFGEFGMAPWGKMKLLLEGSGRIQPKAAEVQNQKHAAFTQEGDGVVISADNPRDGDQWIENDLPFWSPNTGMPGHGLSVDVTGDNSGAVLVIQLLGGGERDYVIKIDFTGKRTFVIPTGEVAWADGRWGRRPGTEGFEYSFVSRAKMGFGYIPAKTSPKVKVENLQLLKDRPSRLVHPTVSIGSGELRVTGEVETGHYLRYTGGAEAGVYDENWKPIKKLPVESRAPQMPSGMGPLRVQVAADAPCPWLEVQFFSEGQPIRVAKQRASDVVK